MKKRITLLLLCLVCAFCCAFGITACGGNDDSNDTTPTKMTETEWQTSLASFAAAKNFSLQMSVNGADFGKMKLVGTTYYDIGEGIENIYVKDGNDYYRYLKNGVNAKWTKSSTTAQNYNQVVNDSACSLILGGTLAISANYLLFNYSDGKYTADKLKVAEGLELKNIEITFKGNAVSKIVCTRVETQYDVLVTVDNIGTTTIEIPEDVGNDDKPVVTCPINAGAKIPAPVGTEVSMLYKTYPELVNKYGKWELYMHTGKDWIKVGDDDKIPYAGDFNCKLVFNGEAEANDVEFVIIAEGGTEIIEITCPVEDNDVIKVPVGTAVSKLYEAYPELVNEYGKWELYMQYPSHPQADGEGYFKPSDEDTVPAEGQFGCKLIFNGEYKAEDVSFTLIGDHSIKYVAYEDAKCNADGNRAYYKCDGCDKYFHDADGENEIVDKTSVLLTDRPKHNYVGGECEVCGAEQPVTEGLEYDVSYDRTYAYVKGKGTATDRDILIASEYEGLPVTSIDSMAFYNWLSITSVTIPDSVTSIKYRAFYGCMDLAKITMTDSVTDIGSDAFGGTAWYRSQPDGVVYVGNIAHAYKGTMPSDTSLTFDEGTKIIGSELFKNNKSLTSVTLPYGVTGIKSAAFSGCTNLSSVSLPESLTHIEYSAFNGCTNLSAVSFPDSLEKIEIWAFQNCTSLAEISIPDNLTKIESCTFSGCTNLSDVYFHDGVTVIESEAFKGCAKLESLSLPADLTYIGASAFQGCVLLTVVDIPDNVTYIGYSAFADCTNLATITVPDGITTMGNYAFFSTAWYNAQPDGPVYIGKVAYKYKGSNTSSVVIEEGTVCIADDFLSFTSIQNVYIPASVTHIGTNAFNGCPQLKNINYGGTEEQWAEIVKGNYWDDNTGNYTVNCGVN